MYGKRSACRVIGRAGDAGLSDLKNRLGEKKTTYATARVKEKKTSGHGAGAGKKDFSVWFGKLQEQFVSPLSLKFLLRPTGGNYALDTPAPIRQWPLFFPTS